MIAAFRPLPDFLSILPDLIIANFFFLKHLQQQSASRSMILQMSDSYRRIVQFAHGGRLPLTSFSNCYFASRKKKNLAVIDKYWNFDIEKNSNEYGYRFYFMTRQTLYRFLVATRYIKSLFKAY